MKRFLLLISLAFSSVRACAGILPIGNSQDPVFVQCSSPSITTNGRPLGNQNDPLFISCSTSAISSGSGAPGNTIVGAGTPTNYAEFTSTGSIGNGILSRDGTNNNALSINSSGGNAFLESGSASGKFNLYPLENDLGNGAPVIINGGDTLNNVGGNVLIGGGFNVAQPSQSGKVCLVTGNLNRRSSSIVDACEGNVFDGSNDYFELNNTNNAEHGMNFHVTTMQDIVFGQGAGGFDHQILTLGSQSNQNQATFGPNTAVIGNSSFTASAFFGDGSHLTGISGGSVPGNTALVTSAASGQVSFFDSTGSVKGSTNLLFDGSNLQTPSLQSIPGDAGSSLSLAAGLGDDGVHPGGTLNEIGGTANDGAHPGGPVHITGGLDASGAVNGGPVVIKGGTLGAVNAGASLTLNGTDSGGGTNGSGESANATLAGGTGGPSASGSLIITGGDTGANTILKGSDNSASGSAGDVGSITITPPVTGVAVGSTVTVRGYAVNLNAEGTNVLSVQSDQSIHITGTGTPVQGFALCINSSGALSHCTSVVGAGGGCTCP